MEPADMSASEIGIQLENLILDARLQELRDILDGQNQGQIIEIEKQFPDKDPVLLALESDHEEIAAYLIDKGFSFDKLYNYPGQACNQWCYLEHRSERCPAQYDALDVARTKSQDHVVEMIEERQKTQATSGLTNSHVENGDMRTSQSRGKQLEKLILEGRYLDIRELLDPLNVDTIFEIEEYFPDRDPVILAVENKHEDLAMFLIEKGFSFKKRYNHANQRCDQWCFEEHQDGKCPCEYDVLELAEEKRLPRVISLIQEILKGLRKPGDGLARSGRNDPRGKQADADPVRDEKNILQCDKNSDSKLLKEEKVDSVTSTNIVNIMKNGNTRLHVTAPHSAASVHACVSEGINVNAQNFDGDTALHLVVRRGNLDAAKALCSNGANLTLRNKLSQTPVDISQGQMKVLLESYKRGLVAAIMKGDHSAMQRVCRLWPNPDAVVKPGKTALQLALEQSEKGQGHQACYNLLNDNRQSMRLVHAVLSQDVNRLKRVLEGSGWNINVRYKDKLGETALSCAVEQHNLQLVQLLLDTDKCKINIRVRENSWTDHTLPLKFKSLDTDCPEEIWRLLEKHSGLAQITDRDSDGNTDLLRAIANGKPASFIQLMIRAASGHNLTQRNQEGLHARELAQKLNRGDVIDVIDQYLFEHPKYFLVNLTVAFYGKQHLYIVNEDGQPLVAAARTRATDADIRAITHCDVIEANAIKLFHAAASGDVRKVVKNNTANYQDKNGYTALTRAIVFNQVKVAETLITTRPVLCSIPDNCSRYPLHYAYALPEDQGKVFIDLILERFGENTEHSSDKDGRLPADYQKLRDQQEISQMLYDARTLDAYGQRGDHPMAAVPEAL